MYARLVTIRGTDVRAVVKFIAERIIPIASGHHGFEHVGVSGDPAQRIVSIVSVWDSMAHLEASDEAIAKLREEGLGTYGGEASVGVFEQTIWERIGSGPVPGCPLRIVAYSVDPAGVDANVKWFESDVLPGITATPGVTAVRHLINRETGEGRVATVYSDEAALKAAEEARAERMAASRARGVTFGEELRLQILSFHAAAS